MPVVFCRAEERLLHGQVVTAWARVIDFNAFVVVDNESAKNDVLKSLLEMACPSGKKLYVFDEATAVEKMKDIRQNVFLIAKSPVTILNLIKSGLKISSLNIGSIHFKPGKKEIFRTVYISDEESEALREMMNMGITCEIQKLPSESKKNVNNLL